MRSLHNEGVKTIFGYPGGSIMPVFDALYGSITSWFVTSRLLLTLHRDMPESAAKWV